MITFYLKYLSSFIFFPYKGCIELPQIALIGPGIGPSFGHLAKPVTKQTIDV